MRGVRCLKKETALFVKNTGGDDRLRNVLADWDSLAVKGNYRAWVEKTPRVRRDNSSSVSLLCNWVACFHTNE